MAYCTLADVMGLAQPKPAWAATTLPTDDQVNQLIEMISADMDVNISAAGYSLPIVDPRALVFLQLTAVYGAASLARQAQYGAGAPEIPENVKMWWDMYQSNLMKIKTSGSILGSQENLTGLRSLQTSRAADGTEDNISDIRTPWVSRDGKF